jgi:single-stranded DNA-binding protein
MTDKIYVDGRLARNPEISTTQKGKPVAKLLLETETVREVRRGEFKAEAHSIPITVYSWLVDDVRELRQGARLTVIAHINGTSFTPEGGSVRFGLQLIADQITFPPARKEAAHTTP